MDDLQNRIINLLKTEGAKTLEQIKTELKTKSSYVDQTVRQLRRFGVLTKVNDYYTTRTVEECVGGGHVLSHIPIPANSLVDYCQNPGINIRKPPFEIFERLHVEAILGLELYAIAVNILTQDNPSQRGKRHSKVQTYNHSEIEEKIENYLNNYRVEP